jgi:hypothetical protein
MARVTCFCQFRFATISPAQRFGIDDLAGSRLDERRPAEKDRALVAHDDRLIAHGRHVGAACRARAEHRRDLRDPERRQARLVIKDASEMVAVRKYLVLARQERPARIDEIDTRQMILLRDFLCPQMLLHGQGIVSTAFHSGIVGNDHAFGAVHPADPAYDSGGRHLVLINLPCRKLADFQERRTLIEEHAYAVPRQELATQYVALPGSLGAALYYLRTQLHQVPGKRLVHREVGGKVVGIAIDLGFNQGHLLSRDLSTFSG